MRDLRASVFIATSLDGYIARENGELDWLPLPGVDGAEDYGYAEFIGRVDALVMGRHSFEKALSFAEWPYAKKRVVILSSKRLEIPARVDVEVELMSGSPLEVVQRLAEQGAEHLYIDGGRTIQNFLAAGLIQELIITTVPVLLGSGIPLFGPLERDIKLRHTATRSFPSGLVQSRYEVS